MSTPRQFSSEVVIGLVVIAMLALLIQPSWMPMGLVLVCIVALALLVFGLGVFVWRESPKDEREYQVTSEAGRAGFLVGGAILTIGVVVQTLQSNLDIWLALALGGMILAKIAIAAKK